MLFAFSINFLPFCLFLKIFFICKIFEWIKAFVVVLNSFSIFIVPKINIKRKSSQTMFYMLYIACKYYRILCFKETMFLFHYLTFIIFFFFNLFYSVMQSVGNSFCGMSSWTALAWYTVMKTAFKTKSRKS